jgi:hypothetical protein
MAVSAVGDQPLQVLDDLLHHTSSPNSVGSGEDISQSGTRAGEVATLHREVTAAKRQTEGFESGSARKGQLSGDAAQKRGEDSRRPNLDEGMVTAHKKGSDRLAMSRLGSPLTRVS